MPRVFVPDETTACALGADRIAQRVQTLLETTGVPVLRNGSRGAFHLEPLIEVEHDQQRWAYGPVTLADVDTLFADGLLPNTEHPLCLGPVEEIEFLAAQTRLTFSRIGEIEPLDYAGYVARGGLDGLQASLVGGPQATLAAIEQSGLRGRGGAAFPAAIKWRTVAEQTAKQKYVVCNADEGDSGTFADRLLMECDPFQLLEAMVISGITVGATQGYIYLRSEYPKAYGVLSAAIEIARQQGLLGDSVLGSEFTFDVQLRLGAGAYVCGEETAMLESLEGRRGMVRKKPPLPAIEGLFGKPTLVHNVLTLAAVTTILARGGDFYAGFGYERSRGTMPFQLGGNVAGSGLVELPFGVSLNEVLSKFACGTRSGRPITLVQLGGPLGAYLPASAWHLPLDYEALSEAGALLGHGGIVVFDDTVDVGAQAEFALRFCAAESCGKCTPCRVGSSKGVRLMQKLRQGESVSHNREVLEELLETMELGSLCALGGLTPLPVRSLMAYQPEVFGERNTNAKPG